MGKELIVVFGKLILFAMKRINTFIIVLLSICFTSCKQPIPSGMEKAFGCVVGKTTLEEFCGLYPEDSYEWGLSWSSPRIEYMMQPDIILPGEVTTIRPFRYSMVIRPGEMKSVILKEGSYRGTAYQRIGMNFENRVLSDISFHVCGGAEKIDPLIAFFREEFSQYYDYDLETPASMAGMDHLQVFFNDGLTTIMLWRRDWSQSEPSEYNPTTEIELEIQIMNTQMKKDWIKTVSQKRSKKVRRK